MINEVIQSFFSREKVSITLHCQKMRDTHPVILMSHGMQEVGTIWKVYEFLAAHGYVVGARAH